MGNQEDLWVEVRLGVVMDDLDRWIVGLIRRRWWLRKLAIQAQQALGGLNVLGLTQEHHADHQSPEDNPSHWAMAQE
jgi:hypothetical protein